MILNGTKFEKLLSYFVYTVCLLLRTFDIGFGAVHFSQQNPKLFGARRKLLDDERFDLSSERCRLGIHFSSEAVPNVFENRGHSTFPLTVQWMFNFWTKLIDARTYFVPSFAQAILFLHAIMTWAT